MIVVLSVRLYKDGMAKHAFLHRNSRDGCYSEYCPYRGSLPSTGEPANSNEFSLFRAAFGEGLNSILDTVRNAVSVFDFLYIYK